MWVSGGGRVKLASKPSESVRVWDCTNCPFRLSFCLNIRLEAPLTRPQGTNIYPPLSTKTEEIRRYFYEVLHTLDPQDSQVRILKSGWHILTQFQSTDLYLKCIVCVWMSVSGALPMIVGVTDKRDSKASQSETQIKVKNKNCWDAITDI